MLNMLKVLRNYGTQEQYVYLLEQIRWGDKRVCSRCGSPEVRKEEGWRGRQSRWLCEWCQYHYSVTGGTIFHGSKLKLESWFDILYYTYGVNKKVKDWSVWGLAGIRANTVCSVRRRVKAALSRPGRSLLKTLLGVLE